MPETLKANMIVPDVWADMVQAEFQNRLVIGAFAQTDTTLEGQPGDTVHFPQFNALTDAVDLTEATAMATEALTTADDTATIKEAGKAVEISDTALLTGYGDPLGEIRRQLGIVVARKIDTDLGADVRTNATHAHTVAGPVTADEVANALDDFGEGGVSEEFAAIIIHSKQHTALRKDDDFQRADTYGSGQVIVQGEVGRIFNIPVVISDRVNVNVDGGGAGIDTYDAIMLKPGSLALLYKRRPQVETDRDILKRTTVLTTNVHYGVKTINPDGVSVLTTQA